MAVVKLELELELWGGVPGHDKQNGCQACRRKSGVEMETVELKGKGVRVRVRIKGKSLMNGRWRKGWVSKAMNCRNSSRRELGGRRSSSIALAARAWSGLWTGKGGEMGAGHWAGAKIHARCEMRDGTVGGGRSGGGGGGGGERERHLLPDSMAEGCTRPRGMAICNLAQL